MVVYLLFVMKPTNKNDAACGYEVIPLSFYLFQFPECQRVFE